jgi:hypothetical membrane protein
MSSRRSEVTAMALHTALISSAIPRRARGFAGALVTVRLAGAVFIALGVGFITVTMLAASIAPGYDYNGAAISDLGAIPETSVLFNGLLILIGLMNVAAGYLLYRVHGGAWRLVAFTVAGLGALGAGLVPIGSGDAHSLFAVLAFLFINLEAIATARLFEGPMRWLAVAAGVTGLIYLGIMVIGDGGNPAIFGAIGHGGSERMIAYPVMLWMIAVGGYLLAQADQSAARQSP